MSALQTSIEELEAKQAIYECQMRYARGVDRHDRDLILSAYHPDAIDDHGVFIGKPDEFVDWVIELHQRSYFSQQHCIFNHYCELEGTVAHTETYYMFIGMNRAGETMSTSGGRYLDRFENRNGRWAIAARVCLRDWAPLKEIPSIFDQSQLTTVRNLDTEIVDLMRTGPQPRRDRNDISYQRPLVIDAARIEAGLDARSKNES